jgi:hypothetical protein
MINNANSELKTTIQKILETDCANLASLLDLLFEHPEIQANATLTGSVSAIKSQYMEIWEKLESACE